VRWGKLVAAGILAAGVFAPAVLPQGPPTVSPQGPPAVSPQGTPAVSPQGSPAGPAPSARDIAAKRAAEWEALAKALDSKIARMLPCDPRAKGAIEEVSRASEARLAAIGEVLKMALAQANADTERVRAALAAEDASLREVETERADSEQERIAVDSQLADLTASAKRREGLDEARKKLAEIAAITTSRVNQAEDQFQLRATLDISLRDLMAAGHARQVAIQNEQAALAAEASRWSDYYAARLARAQVECSITGAPSSPQRKKG
jgi:hypothetical protein